MSGLPSFCQGTKSIVCSCSSSSPRLAWGSEGNPPPLPAGQSLSDVFLLAYSLFPSPGWGQEAEGHWHRASEPHVGQKSLIGKTEFQFWRMNVTQQEDKVA